MNRYYWLLRQSDLSTWLKPELAALSVQASDQLLDLPKPGRAVDPQALDAWCQYWLGETGWRVLRQREQVAVLRPRLDE